MGAYENKLKVTLSSVNAPVLIAIGSLIPGVGASVEKLLSAAASSNGLATTGQGTISNSHLRFVADNFASWALGSRLILDIPLAQVTGLYRGSHYLGGYFFTLRYAEASVDMCAIYGGGAFLDQLEREVQTAGGRV